MIINFYSQDKAFRVSKKVKAEFWNCTFFLNMENCHGRKILKKEQISRAVKLRELIRTAAFLSFVSQIKSCRWIIDSWVLPWAMLLESFYYRIKMKIVNFNQKSYSCEWTYIFLAILTVSFSKAKKGSRKLMLCQMHNYSNEKSTYKYICAYLGGCVSELWLLHSQPGTL